MDVRFEAVAPSSPVSPLASSVEGAVPEPASDKGGRTGAVLSSLIASCKRLRVEPFAYLRDLFLRISTHPHHRLDELLPDKWLLAQRPVSRVYEQT